jgi:acetylornithine deacetylase/succinyl-diaminopimelate desuccinylase-like protein
MAAYGGCIDIRFDGARMAASKGATAVMIRSLTHRLDTFPHTGSMQYGNASVRIPAVAISTQDAEWLSLTLRNLKRQGKRPRVSLYTHCYELPDTLSYNVIGDWYGTKNPKEWMVVGGHLDSWDVGEGAHDDGAGCVHSVEAVRLLKAVGYRPTNSLRVVLFMNEENGARGARVYAEWAAESGQKQRVGLESDRGGFAPREFSSEASVERIQALQPWLKFLEPYGVYAIRKGGSGVDVGFLRPQGTELYGLVPESQRYFDYHHAATDVFESVNRRELELGSASMAALLYLLDLESQ